MTTTTPEILALGEPMLEFTATSSNRLRDVPEFTRGWGGDTCNFIIAAARLGARTGYITRVGEDEFGQSFRDLWEREGVDASRVQTDAESPTGIYFIAHRPDGGHDFTYYRRGSAASRIRPSDLDLEYIKQAKVFHTSGISQAISTSACESVFAAIEAAREGGALISYDPNLRLKLWSLPFARAVILQTMSLAQIVLPSLEDGRALFGVQDPRKIVDGVLRAGARVAVVKLGPEGCLVGTRDGDINQFPGYRVDVVDAAGAGDGFDAAFVTEYLAGKRIGDAARFANAVGALVCRGPGAIAPLPRRDQVEAFMRDSGG